MANQQQKRLRWGMLGAARIGRAIVGALNASPRGELAAVASRDAGRAAEYARAHGIPRWFGRYEALLADPDIDVIYNPLPNHLHREWTVRALDAGKHVLCEKPFALSVEDVDAMFAAAARTGRVLAEAFMYRHHPKILKARELVQAGAIGQVRLFRSSFSFLLDRPNDVRWNPEMGGGALWDVGCYPVSFAQYLLGGVPQRVEARQVIAPSGVDEFFVATMDFGADRAAQFDCAFRAPFRQGAEIVGTQGMVWLNLPYRPDDRGSVITLRTGEDGEQVLDLPNPERYGLEVEDMHDAVLNGTPPLIPPSETRATVETILRLYEGARGG